MVRPHTDPSGITATPRAANHSLCADPPESPPPLVVSPPPTPLHVSADAMGCLHQIIEHALHRHPVRRSAEQEKT